MGGGPNRSDQKGKKKGRERGKRTSLGMRCSNVKLLRLVCERVVDTMLGVKWAFVVAGVPGANDEDAEESKHEVDAALDAKGSEGNELTVASMSKAAAPSRSPLVTVSKTRSPSKSRSENHF